MNGMLELIKALCALPGPSGHENAVREFISGKAAPLADEILTDSMGNLLVYKHGKRYSDKRIMLAAHMDEVGIIILAAEEDGFLKFDFVGGVDRRVAIGEKVLIGDSAIPGVIGVKAIHLSDALEREIIPKTESMYIDIGASSREEAQKLVRPGDYGVFDTVQTEFGDGYFKARALDDRTGCAVLLKLLESELPCDTWFAFTVQEEVGCRGAQTAAFRIRPDVALVIEGTTAADLPSQKGPEKVCSPGKGPVIPFMDGGSVYDRELFSKLCALADNNGITWQTKTMIAGGTDAGVIQRSGSGTKIAAISAALRNIHSPSCVGCVRDFDQVLLLARLFLEEL